jgi:hypothetical protein
MTLVYHELRVLAPLLHLMGETDVNHFEPGLHLMLTAAFASLAADAPALAAAQVPPEAERIGVYVLSAIFGVLVAGLISCAREIRADLTDRRP